MPIAFVSGINANGNSFTSPAINTTGASLLVVATGVFNPTVSGIDPSVITDSNSNVWVEIGFFGTGTTNCGTGLWYAKNPIVGAGHTFTLTSSQNFNALCAAAFSGVDTVSPLDQSTGNQGASNDTPVTSIQTGSVTPLFNNELIISGGVFGSPAFASGLHIDSGFTIQVQDDGSASFPDALAYLVQTIAGGVNPTWSWSTANQTAVSIATFKAAAAPPVTAPVGVLGLASAEW